MTRMRRPLWPPLDVIEACLAGEAPDSPGQAEAVVLPVSFDAGPAAAADLAVPPFLKEAFARREAVATAGFSGAPEAGQIRSVPPRVSGESGDVSPPLPVLLDRAIGNGPYWKGWVVAPEADYATDRDVVLEERDAPVDPVAAMVQTWNAVQVDPAGGAILGRLSEDRLDAVREVARGVPVPDDIPEPGLVFLRDLPGGQTVLSGTMLGELDDPRRHYQRLYRMAARSIEVGGAAVASPGRRVAWLKPAFAVAATLLIAQSAVLIGLQLQPPDDGVSVWRSAGEANAGVQLRIIFKADARESEIRALLGTMGGQFVAGPDAYGEYVIRIDKLPLDQALLQLRASPLVDSVEGK